MTADLTETTQEAAPRTRRNVLAGALGGLAGAAAVALGRPAPAEAAAGDALRIGLQNAAGTSSTRLSATSSGGAFWMTQNGTGSGVRGDSTGGHGGVFTSNHAARNGLYGQNLVGGGAPDLGGAGVRGNGDSTVGVMGVSANHHGVMGVSTGNPGAGVFGTGGVYGVHGVSEEGVGVKGEAMSLPGVVGVSQSGHGVEGTSGSGFAGFFAGPVQVTKQLDLNAMVSPGNPPDGARVFARLSMGQWELCVIFPTGSIHVIETESAT